MTLALAWMLAMQVSAALTDTSGKLHNLSDYSGKTVVLAFWSFKCPVSLAYDERLASLQERYGPRGVVVLGVASNSNESAAEIRRNAANLKIAFPILLDEGASLADRLGATRTPSVYILDAKGVVRYKGGVAQAEEALDAVVAGREVPTPETRPSGCTIRR
jgi:peroxiredoxin